MTDKDKLFNQYDKTIAQVLEQIAATNKDNGGINVENFDLEDKANLFLLHMVEMARGLFSINVKYKCDSKTFSELKKLYPNTKIKKCFIKKNKNNYNVKEHITEFSKKYYSNIYDAYYLKKEEENNEN